MLKYQNSDCCIATKINLFSKYVLLVDFVENSCWIVIAVKVHISYKSSLRKSHSIVIMQTKAFSWLLWDSNWEENNYFHVSLWNSNASVFETNFTAVAWLSQFRSVEEHYCLCKIFFFFYSLTSFYTISFYKRRNKLSISDVKKCVVSYMHSTKCYNF